MKLSPRRKLSLPQAQFLLTPRIIISFCTRWDGCSTILIKTNTTRLFFSLNLKKKYNFQKLLFFNQSSLHLYMHTHTHTNLFIFQLNRETLPRQKFAKLVIHPTLVIVWSPSFPSHTHTYLLHTIILPHRLIYNHAKGSIHSENPLSRNDNWIIKVVSAPSICNYFIYHKNIVIFSK